MTAACAERPLAHFLIARAGNNKIIKGTQSATPSADLVQGFSASGPDVWVEAADYTREGVVVSAVGARCGKTFLASGAWTAIANTHVLLPGPDIDVRWLWYRTNDENFWVKGGSAQPFVKVGETLRKPCYVPPINEQRRIVAILDEAFSGIAIAKANAETNLQNARELFSTALAELFSNASVSWLKTTIGDCIGFIDYRGKTPIKTESGLRLITAKNVKMGYLQREPEEFAAPDSYDSWMTRGIPVRGDVLFTTEAPCGNVAQLDTSEKVIFAQRIIIMQPDARRLDSTFLKYALLSPALQKRIQAKATGATALGIKASLLRTIEISFPKEMQEQRRIVDGLDTLRNEISQLQSIYTRKLATLDELKQSLLHQAFSGQL